MNIMRYFIPAAAAIVAAAGFTSCLGGDDNYYDYTEWINQNETYLTRMEDTIGADGKKVFEKITPAWAPGIYVLAQWHNDRSLTAGNLIPMDNSTCEVVYQVAYVDGTVFDSSYAEVDSVKSFKPTETITGFWTMLTNMHVGDSVTCVIPMTAGYGVSGTGVMPYSTLIYGIKLKSISKYEIRSN